MTGRLDGKVALIVGAARGISGGAPADVREVCDSGASEGSAAPGRSSPAWI
ncbi:MAG: hypothetical protein QOJ73_5036 [Streptosporangiaceae bacterium]|jgi:hypothetical protein|nr:hypothetical protein [Streptosporangiaceae bacterium]